MVRLLPCMLARVVVLVGALRAQGGVVGDQALHQYPAVSVHVPEPAGEAPEAQVTLDALKAVASQLTSLEHRLVAQERTSLESLALLGERVDALAGSVGAMVSSHV